MARIALPLPQFTEPIRGAIRWEDTTAGLGDVSRLRAGDDATGYLVVLHLRPVASGRVIVGVTSALPGDSTGAELTDAWERSPRAVTLRVDGLADLVIPGPNHASSADPDATEPYGWRVAAGAVAAHSAWRDAFLALTPAQQQSATVALDDGATLEGVARAAVRVRRRLSPMRFVRAAVRFQGGLRHVPIPGAYLTTDGDVLDEICWRRYGREDAVPDVLAANRGLADVGAVLPAGVLLVLPDLPNAGARLAVDRLWEVAPRGVVLPERADRAVRLTGVFRAAVRVVG